MCSSPPASPEPIASAGSTAYALGIAFGMFSATEWTPEHITDLMPVGALPAWHVWYSSSHRHATVVWHHLQGWALSWHLRAEMPCRLRHQRHHHGGSCGADQEGTLPGAWHAVVERAPLHGRLLCTPPTALNETCGRVHPLVNCLGTTCLSAPLCLCRMRRRWSCRPPPQRWTPCATSR